MPADRPGRWLLVFPALLLAACTSLFDPQRQFEPVQRDFAMRLRWMDFPGAARHLSPQLRDDFLDRVGGEEDLHVTDVRLDSAEYLPAENRMVTWTTLEYYLLPSTVVRKFRLRQEWEYAGEDRQHSGNWQIVTPFPELRGAEPPVPEGIRPKRN